MARLSVLSDEVQTVVRGLVPVLLASGNTAGVCRELNSVLETLGESRRLHPNRLHALLSDDVGRGVNDGTIELVRSALDGLDPNVVRKGHDRMATLRGRALAVREREGADLGQIAENLGVPRAVARAVIFSENATFAVDEAPNFAPHSSLAPDWSYQDTAVGRVLDALRRRPHGCVGLVLPTGAGKTRVALRIILERLATAEPGARVLWITHTLTLKRQAFVQLNKLLASSVPLPKGADTLANRIVFTMVAALERTLAEQPVQPALIVVDEGHHAAAPIYARLFAPPPPCPVLLLTATPNRSDELPIGVEEIAFTITYRELAERGTILIPEFIPFQVPNFDWSPDTLDDLIDALIDETSDRFRKVLVLAPRVDRVEEFYARLADRLQHEVGHPLSAEDVGYIHGTVNSLGIADEDFLERFADKPRAVLVSAQVLLEGFDDPSIDTVVLTYPTSSVIRLMQAAGRCVRRHEGKSKCYVVQANNADLAYRFDQRWLYQEISDFLRPELVDIAYSTRDQRQLEAARLLDAHNVARVPRHSALAQVEEIPLDHPLKLLFYGLPYFGLPERFATDSRWGVFVETPQNSAIFRQVFNAYCDLGANLADPTDLLAKLAPPLGFGKDLTVGSLWRGLVEVLTAAYFARQELYGTTVKGIQGERPPTRPGPSSWLRYVTLDFAALVPAALSAFLSDCHNLRALESAYLVDPSRYTAAVKTPVPLGGFEGALLEQVAFDDLTGRLDQLAASLRQTPPAERFSALAAALATAAPWPLPAQFVSRIDMLLTETGRQERLLQI